MLKRIEGRSRTKLLAVAALIWGSFWLVVALSSGFTPVVAGVMIALGFGVFALGEMIFSPVGPSLINSFAPPHLRGRNNAFGGLTWGVSSAIGPAVAGVVIGGGWGVAWALGLTVGCVVAAAILYSLRNLLTPEEDGRVGPASAVAAEVGG